MTLLRSILATLSLLCLGTLASAQDGLFEVHGVGPEGSYQGNAWVQKVGSGRFRVALRTFDGKARERRFEARARREGELLRFRARARRDGHSLSPLRVRVQRTKPGAATATYVDAKGRTVRREAWTRPDALQVPVTVVTLRGQAAAEGKSAFPDVARPEQTQKRVVAQLVQAYASLKVGFRVIHAKPIQLKGATFDLDGNGRLSRSEAAALGKRLEELKIKQPGRVVLVVTAAPFVRPGCRGWTAGDAPATPDTLLDRNDNLSLVGLAYLDPARFHTVAHEIGHQLGLDDVRSENRHHLKAPERRDHLMESGGAGVHLDPVVRKLLARALFQSIDHGLEGSGAPAATGLIPLHEKSEGLPLLSRR